MRQAAFERIRERRIRNEWEWLRRTALADPAALSVPDSPSGAVLLAETPFYSLNGAPRKGVAVRFAFPEYYPSVPLEAWLAEPVLHPNVHPETGFVCLWDTRHEGTSLVEAVLQLQRVVTWHLFNYDADHLMQPDAGRRPALPYRQEAGKDGMDLIGHLSRTENQLLRGASQRASPSAYIHGKSGRPSAGSCRP